MLVQSLIQNLFLCRLSVVQFVIVVLVFVLVHVLLENLSLCLLSAVLFVIVALVFVLVRVVFVRYGCQYVLLGLFLFVFVGEGLVYLSVAVLVCVVSFLSILIIFPSWSFLW